MSRLTPGEEDQLDGCDIDFAAEAVNDETTEYLPLFPLEIPDVYRAAEWKALFDAS
ncbi:MAG TPA: hypothetical protein VM938_10665 [Acidimicrobiales bacterium]|nr:hypothetical protein [Acidimicrobiales bacterium]